jgi:hypothetical protein
LEPQHHDGKPTILNLRIAPELREELARRSTASGRPNTTEALRLIQRGLMAERSLGLRGESGFDLALTYALNGTASLVDMLIKRMGETPAHLHQIIQQVEYNEKFASLPPERQAELLYGRKPEGDAQ